MAEAAVDLAVNRFFCHKCAQEINPVLPDFICPRCRSGFIEELEETCDTPSSDNTDDEPEQSLNLEQVWGQIISGLDGNPDAERSRFGRQRSRPRRFSSRGFGRGQDVNREIESPHLSPIRRGRQTRYFNVSHGRNPSGNLETLPIEDIIQQALTNLSAGITGSTGFPILLNLHGNPGDYAWGRGGLDAIITQLLNQMDGSGPPPLPKEVISQIPTVNISSEQVSKTLQCTVCMEDFKIGEPVRKLPCLHHFHNSCIVPWLELHGTCPICRKVLSGGFDSENDVDIIGGNSSSSSSYSSDMSTPSSSDNTNSSSAVSSSTSSTGSSHYSDYYDPPSVYDFNEDVD